MQIVIGQRMPKKRGTTVIQNEKGQLVSTQLLTGLRIYVITKFEIQPLPFMDQMLDRLVVWVWSCFLDGYSSYYHISIKDQGKTIFTYPYGTFAFKRMSFGLYDALTIFQRRILSIFIDMAKDSMEVFMVDILVKGHTFDQCLSYLEKVLQMCVESNLVRNWKK